MRPSKVTGRRIAVVVTVAVLLFAVQCCCTRASPLVPCTVLTVPYCTSRLLDAAISTSFASAGDTAARARRIPRPTFPFLWQGAPSCRQGRVSKGRIDTIINIEPWLVRGRSSRDSAKAPGQLLTQTARLHHLETVIRSVCLQLHFTHPPPPTTQSSIA